MWRLTPCLPKFFFPHRTSQYDEQLSGGAGFSTKLRAVRQQINLQSEDRHLESEVVKMKDLGSWYQSRWNKVKLPAHMLPMRGDDMTTHIGRAQLAPHTPLTLSRFVER